MARSDFWWIKIFMDSTFKQLLRIPPDCSVDLFVKKCRLMVDLSKELHGRDFQVKFLEKTLAPGDNKKLSYFNIEDNSIIHITLKPSIETGMVNDMAQLEPYPGYITVTTSEQDVDMLSLDNSTTERRARMPCGHIIGRSSMASYCQSVLATGMSVFRCPAILTNTGNARNQKCNQEWPYFLVRHVALLSPEETVEIDKSVSENYLNREAGMQQCPHCHVWGFRANRDTNCASCTICSREAGKPYLFCWSCLIDWKTPDTLHCGNADCDGRDKRIRILADCPIKEICKGVFTPAIRGCPKCGLLIEHKEYCKHMYCVCGFSFCFCCLKPKSTAEWSCDPYRNLCVVALRQTTLPGS